jgi:putative transcriptional regulator
MKNKLKIERAILNITQELAQKWGFSPNDKLHRKDRFVPSTILALKLSKLFEKPVNEF